MYVYLLYATFMKLLLLLMPLCFVVSVATSQSYKSGDTSVVTLIDTTDFIDSLTFKNSLYINFTSTGCFDYFSRKLKIFKQGQNYKLLLYPGKGYRLFDGKKILVKKESIKELVLTSEEINQIRDFEKEAKIYNCEMNCGCTTTDIYEFRINNSTKKCSDSGCYWHGFNKLIKKLFEVSK